MGFDWGTKPQAVGVHTSRTIMYNELSRLFDAIPAENADFEDYQKAVVQSNVLGLKTQSNREITWKNLTQLYGFRQTPLFRNFRRLWTRSTEADHPVLTVIAAMSRDLIFRESANWLDEVALGTEVSSGFFLERIQLHFPGRYSPATARSTSQALFSSWTHAGWLAGANPVSRPRKIAKVGAGALALALFIAWSEGLRGDQLFGSCYVRLLQKELPEPKTVLWEAHRNSFINYYETGGISDIRFPGWLTPQEEEALHGSL